MMQNVLNLTDKAADRVKSLIDKSGDEAVVGLRFGTSQVSQGAAEVLAYGTAVRLAPAED